MTSRASQFDVFDRELALAQKLTAAGVFSGSTEHRLRLERCRKFILEEGIEEEPCGYGQSYREFFEATYRETL